jgi:protein phosphatase
MEKVDPNQDTLPLPDETFRAPATLDFVRVEFGAKSHVGNVRTNNEDQYLVGRARKSLDVLATGLRPDQVATVLERDGYILLVADGVGGRAGGEHASALVVNEAIRYVMETAKWFFRLDDPDEAVRMRLLQEALERVDRQLREEAERDPRLTGMGTTLTALTVIGSAAFVVNVGDSRAYLFRDGKLEQITTDQTLVRQMVAAGLVGPEAARTHRLRHVITSAIGGSPGVEAEMIGFAVNDGDRLLLCTDGLHDPVDDQQIASILTQLGSPQDACRALIEAALDNGGPDNVTVIVADCSMENQRRSI